jgi:hypothetical protein
MRRTKGVYVGAMWLSGAILVCLRTPQFSSKLHPGLHPALVGGAMCLQLGSFSDLGAVELHADVLNPLRLQPSFQRLPPIAE